MTASLILTSAPNSVALPRKRFFRHPSNHSIYLRSFLSDDRDCDVQKNLGSPPRNSSFLLLSSLACFSLIGLFDRMPCGLLEVLKECFGLQQPSFSSKQSRLQVDDDQIDDIPTFKCFAANTHKMMMQEICRDRAAIGLKTIDEKASDPVVSIIQLDLSQKESFSDSHSQTDCPSRPLSIDVHLKTEYEFLSAIYEAQLYKNACTSAEATARQRFEHGQEMEYLKQALHARSIAAKANLQRLQLRAQEAGFTQLACLCVRDPKQACGEEGCSVDVGNQYRLDRLYDVEVIPATHISRGIHSRSHSV